MPNQRRAAYSMSGTGLIFIGGGFILAAISSLFPSQGLSLLGLVITAVGIVLFFMEWSAFTPSERRFSAYGAGLYIIALIASVLVGASLFTVNYTSHSLFHSGSPLAAPLQAVGDGFTGILLYLSFLLFPYAFARREEKTMLLVGFVGGFIVAVVLNPIAIGGSLYNITNISGLVRLVTDIVSLIFGVSYLVIGNNVRIRR